MKCYGYARISTPKQSIDRQIRNIRKEYPEAHIVEEKYTGTTIDRPEWNKLHKRLKSGDTVVFDSVSRMSRNADEGFALYKELYDKGVNLVYLKEPLINTATYKSALESNIPLTGTNVDYILEGVNRYLMALAQEQIRLAFEQAQKEVDDLRQRTKEGIETARLNDKQIGRKTGTTVTTRKSIEAKKIIRNNARDFGGSLNDTDTRTLAGCSRNTFYKYKREIKAELNAK